VLEDLGCCLYTLIGVEVDRRGKCGKFVVKLLLPLLHGLFHSHLVLCKSFVVVVDGGVGL
jgi:hypothetical protein